MRCVRAKVVGLSEPSPQHALPEETPQETPTAEHAASARLVAVVMRLHAWAAGHWIRSTAIAGTITLLVVATLAIWAYLANLAIQSGQLTLDNALAALDQSDYEQARTLVRRMLSDGRLPSSAQGGPLFVLGAIKANDAELQAIPERRRGEFLLASRYLREARHYGFPPERETDGYFMLGKSLLASLQYAEGIAVLEEALATKLTPDNPLALAIHRLLAETCLLMPYPDLDKAMSHNTVLFNSTELSPEDRANAVLLRAEIMRLMDRFDEASEVLASLPPTTGRQSRQKMLQAHLVLDAIVYERQHSAPQDLEESTAATTARIKDATELLEAARTMEPRANEVTRRCDYLLGRAFELRGDEDAALRQFARLRQLYGDTSEGMAATLAEADIVRRRGEAQRALIGYRRVMEKVTDPGAYRSLVLSFEELRQRVLDALTDFVERQHFDEALSMLAHFVPLFSRTEQLQLRGETLEHWGDLLLGRATNGTNRDEAQRAAALRRLREAGLAYEQLAAERFATSYYTDDLWKSAEDYYRGHSYSSTVRLLDKYLENEPERRNSQALLRLGQAQLALGNIAESIASLEECIEFHPRDGATYQARIDCAKAYWYQGNTDEAERLLRDNLTGSTLKPSSQEWKDSLFTLGLLLHEKGRHEQSIATLEEAVQRYPQDPQTLLAQYVAGESYRRWADQALERVQQARTASERDKYGQTAAERLSEALRYFDVVQRSITLRSHGIHNDALMGAMLRNCYMLEGTVLFDLGRYEEAIKAYSNVSSLYPNDPFVLETFVQIANCWRRLDRPDKARGAILQAQIALDQLPSSADFATTTSFNREEWRLLLGDMSRW
jgi:tetratricopeptide (TPR) repeat protein